MFHNVLIVIHALSALLGLAVGSWLIYKLPDHEDERFRLYLGTLVSMLIFMVLAILTSWADIANVTRGIFSGLAILGCYMVFRGIQARQVLRAQGAGWQERFIDHVGFTLISLFEGFVIVSIFDLHSPIWLILLIAVAAVVIGINILRSVKRRVIA